MARKQKSVAAKIKTKVKKGAMHLKNNDGTQSVKTKDIITNTKIFTVSRFLYFSHPNKIPPKTKPTKAKDIPHKKYINPIETALLGKIYMSETRSMLPPNIQLTTPRPKVIAHIIKDGFKEKSLISCSMRSKKLPIFLSIFKKITSQ